jgi:flagellar biosynthesis/type III secretory pathway chaperone
MERETCHRQLLELLRETIEQAAILRQQLADEAAALAGNNADQLESTVAEKNKSVRKLEQLEKQRQKLFDEAGFASNRYGADACIKWCDQHGMVKRNCSRTQSPQCSTFS